MKSNADKILREFFHGPDARPVISRRDHFAAAAMAALIQSRSYAHPDDTLIWDAIKFADALIAELDKP